MKNYFLAILISVVPLYSFANQVELLPGQSMQFKANQEVTVTCISAPQPSECQVKADAFMDSLKTCKEKGSHCIMTLFPDWTARNPDCFEQGHSKCIEFCNGKYELSACSWVYCK